MALALWCSGIADRLQAWRWQLAAARLPPGPGRKSWRGTQTKAQYNAATRRHAPNGARTKKKCAWLPLPSWWRFGSNRSGSTYIQPWCWIGKGVRHASHWVGALCKDEHGQSGRSSLIKMRVCNLHFFAPIWITGQKGPWSDDAIATEYLDSSPTLIHKQKR